MANPDPSSSNNQNRYESLVASAIDAIVTTDDKGLVIELNASAERMFGWAPHEVIGKLISDLILPDRLCEDSSGGMCHFGVPVSGVMQSDRHNIEAIHRNGHEFPVELTMIPILNEDRVLMTLILRDMTQSKALTSELQIASFTIQQSSDSIYWINKDGSIWDCNIAAAAGLGHTREELLKMSVLDIDPGMTRDGWAIHWDDLREVGSVQIESVHQRSDGSTFPIDVSANYIVHNGKEYNCAFVRNITMRKSAERAVSESSERLSLVLDAAELGFWDWDFRSGKKIVNAQYCHLFGVTQEEFSPDPVWFQERIHPDDYERIMTLLTDHIASESERIDAQYRIQRADGVWRWIHDRGRVIERDPDGEAVRMMGAMQDITHMKEASDALSRSEQRFRDIVASIGEFIWETDGSFVIQFITDSITKLIGFERERVIGTAFYEMTTEDYSYRVRSFFESSLKSGKPIRDFEMPVVAQDGELRWVRLNAQPIKSKDGYTGYRGTGQDITAEREAALAKDRSIKLRVITRSIVMDLLKPGELTEHIETLLARLGEFLGADRVYMLRAESSIDRVLCSSYWYSDRIKDDGTLYPLSSNEIDPEWITQIEPNQAKILYRDTESDLPSWVHHSIKSHLGLPVLIDGVPVNYLAFEGLDDQAFWREDDISVLLSLASSLGYAIERRITKRKLEESAQQLEFEARRAEAANEAKSVFLAQMSHELRTPLTAVIGSAQILQAKLDPTRESQLLASIDSNGRMLLSIINSILDLSKFERGETPIHPERTLLVDMIEQVRSSVMPIAMIQGVDIVFEVTSPIPAEIFIDGFQLAQVLMNLINNSLKYAQSPHIRIELSISKESVGMLEFSVIDKGIGIKKEDLERIFEPFERVSQVTSSGTGLGLSICKRIVEALGGTIQSESEMGERTRFWFTVPIGAQPFGELVTGELAPVNPTRVVITGENEWPLLGTRVLLAEDSLHIREVVEYFLLDMGAEVEVCADGLQAVNRIRDPQSTDQPIDVILMDMQMPIMDGYVATHTLRNEGCEIPIIALTAHGMSEDRKKCIDIGCDDYLGKPINPELLAMCIRRVVRGSVTDSEQTNAADQSDSMECASSSPPDNLVVRYKAHLRELVDDLDLNKRDMESVRRLVHQIKGTAGTMGLVEIASAALRADEVIRQEDNEDSINNALVMLVERILA